MFQADERGMAMSFFSAAPFMGPVLGPIVGGFVAETVGWRWVEGVMAIFTGVLWIMGSLYLPETYPPVLLRKRAAKLSQMTGKVYKSKGDVDQGPTTFGHVFKTSLSRPWILLFREPIVLLLSIYMAIIYGTLYMLFAAFPIVYQQERGWSQGIGGLAFLGVAVGMIMAVSYSLWDNKRYVKISHEHDGFAPPEARLPPCMIGGICIPIGLFWFAWTNSPSIHWIASIAAGIPFGFGMVLVFLSIMNYLIDAYTIFAASVLAANSVLRSLFGAAVCSQLDLCSIVLLIGFSFHYLLRKCTPVWGYIGRPPFRHSLPWLAFLSRSSSTSTDPVSVKSASMPRRQLPLCENSKKARTIALRQTRPRRNETLSTTRTKQLKINHVLKRSRPAPMRKTTTSGSSCRRLGATLAIPTTLTT